MMAALNALETGPTFITNGGTETYLQFQQGFPLRDGCAFEIFDDPQAWARLEQEYLVPILDAAEARGHAAMLDALVWRAHPDYLASLGYPDGDLRRFNTLAVGRTRAAIQCWRAAAPGRDRVTVLVSADLGPRGDGYRVEDDTVTPEAAKAYHRRQIQVLAGAGVDVISAITMTSVAETIGLVEAANECGLPIIVSPTVETDGRVPDGTTLPEFIRLVDEATHGAVAFYMVNCAHPTHIRPVLDAALAEEAEWLERFRGFRANASIKSHQELDESPTLDRGCPSDLAAEMAQLHEDFELRVVGGCCGTDPEHIGAIAAAIQ